MKNRWTKAWRNKSEILEGIKNKIIRNKIVEDIAEERITVCKKCESYDTTGEGCLVKGTQPCCNELNGGCGCSLSFKTRSLSSSCPKSYWTAVMTEEEEDKLNQEDDSI